MKRYLVMIIIISVFASCTAFSQLNAIKNLQYELKGFNIGMPALGEIVLLADIDIYNPNNTDVEINRVEYEIFINGEKVADGITDEHVKIKKKSNAVYHTKITPDMQKIKGNAMNMLTSDDIKGVLKGNMTFNTALGEHTFPFTIEKSFKE